MTEWQTFTVTLPEQREYVRLHKLAQRCYALRRDLELAIEYDDDYDSASWRDYQLDMCSTALIWSRDSLDIGIIGAARQWTDLVAFVLEFWLPEGAHFIAEARRLADDIADYEARMGEIVHVIRTTVRKEGTWPSATTNTRVTDALPAGSSRSGATGTER